jgi:hypothetical protein
MAPRLFVFREVELVPKTRQVIHAWKCVKHLVVLAAWDGSESPVRLLDMQSVRRIVEYKFVDRFPELRGESAEEGRRVLRGVLLAMPLE